MYTSVVLGGTFNELHNGHKALLQKAFAVGNHVTIGLTTDAYVEKYKQKEVREQRTENREQRTDNKKQRQAYAVRKKILEQWFLKNGWQDRVTIVPLEDAYGPTVVFDFDAIIVSEETEPVAEKINILRQERGMTPLTIVTIPFVNAEDGAPISTTRIISGVIDTKGQLRLPMSLRSLVRKPLGDIIADGAPLKEPPDSFIISVGDATTKRLLENTILPHIAAVDFQIERKPVVWEQPLYTTLSKHAVVTEFTSGPGYISSDILKAIEHSQFSKQEPRQVFVIDGEEDLLVLPLLVHAPLGTVLYYGQPKKGLVRVVVTSSMKKRVASILSQFVGDK